MKSCPASVIRYRLQEVFIVPEDNALPPLKWDRQTQRFSLIPDAAAIADKTTSAAGRPSPSEELTSSCTINNSNNNNYNSSATNATEDSRRSSGDHKRPTLGEDNVFAANNNNNNTNGTVSPPGGIGATSEDFAWNQVRRLLSASKGRSPVSAYEPLSPSCDAGGYVVSPTSLHERRAVKPSTRADTPNASADGNCENSRGEDESKDVKRNESDDEENRINNSELDDSKDLETWRCAALYGVLAVGSACHVLIYASEVTPVARLPPSDHVVYAVKKFDYLQLPPPSATSSSSSSSGPHAEETAKDEPAASPQSHSRHRSSRMKGRQNGVSGGGGGARDAHSNAHALSENTVTEYLAVVQRFCNRCDHTGSAYFYFSYTANLALDGKDIIAASRSNQRRNGPPTPSALRKTPSLASGGPAVPAPAPNGETVLERQPTHHSDSPPEYGTPSRFTHDRYAFQWNYPLTTAFSFQEESAAAILAATASEFLSGLSSGAAASSIPAFGSDVSLSHVSSSTLAPPVLADQLSMRSSSTVTQQGYHGANAVGALLSLYIPSFIRGVVVQTDFLSAGETSSDDSKQRAAGSGSGNVSEKFSGRVNGALVTRLCRHWSGTRYNRRGLDMFAKTGYSANSAVTALWVWSDTGVHTGSPTQSDVSATAPVDSVPRIAVYTLVRGSIPCVWAQPADLTFKPQIRIAESDSNGAEELFTHIHALRCLLPYMEGLHCIDTTSLSKLEHPLSEAFATAVESFNEDEELRQQVPSEFELIYTKYNVKKKMKKYSRFSDMSEDLLSLLGLAAKVPKNPHSPTSGDDLSLVPASPRLGPQSYAAFDQWENCGADDRDNEEPSGATRSATAVRASRDSGLAASSNVASGSQLNGSTTQRSLPSVAFGKFNSVQRAFFRINCLDCLDRTNLTQSIIALHVLPEMIQYVTSSEESEAASPTKETTEEKENEPTTTPTPAGGTATQNRRRNSFLDAANVSCRRLWAANGIALSHLYAGSEAHFISYLVTGKKGKLDKFHEGSIAMRRWYQQNFHDGDKQDVVTLLTRQHDPQPSHATTESPFARRLSGLNKMVMFGTVVATLASVLNGLLMMCVPAYRLRHDLVVVGVFWCAYLCIIWRYIMKDCQSYTNYPLLK